MKGLLLAVVLAALPIAAQDGLGLEADGTPVTEQTTETERDPAEMTRDERLNRPIPDYRVDDADRPSLNSGSLLIKTIGSLMVVVGLAMLVGYLAKRLMPGRFGGSVSGNHLKILQTLPLGPKRFVTLLEADGQRLLIGVTDQRIELIKALDEPSFGETLAGLEEPKRVRELEETL